MKRKSLLFLLLMAMFAPLAMNGQTLTVCSGTEENQYIPFYAYSGDTEGTTSEFIIPASELTALNGKEITALKFYLSQSQSKTWTAVYKVYMTEVATTQLTRTIGPDAGTVVYQGTVDASGTEMTITFNQGHYTYNGGHLLIGTYVATDGAYDSYGKFYGIQATSAAYLSGSWGGYDDGAIDFIPKTTFSYLSDDPYINLTPAAATVLTGFTETLTATYGNVSGTPTITYSSSNTSVATVSGSGTTATVTGVAPGTATITATMNGSFTAQSTITVEDPSYCTPSFSDPSDDYIKKFVTSGGTTNIDNTSTYETGGYSDYYSTQSASIYPGETLSCTVTPNSTSYEYGHAIWVDWNKDYEFASSERVAYSTSTATGNWTGSFTIPANTAAGDYRMRVIHRYNNTPSATDACMSASYGEAEDYKLTVFAASTDPSITLSPATATIYIDDTETLTAVVRNVTNPTITYTSSNTSVATVSGNGTTATVTGVAAGTATITASMTVSGTTYTATSTINVQLDPCTKVIPYTYGFEDATDFSCWTLENCEECSNNSSLYGRYYSSSYARTGNYSFVFSSYCGEEDPQYLISPKLSGVANGVHVEFYYKIVDFSQAPETFEVGYSTTDNNVSSFTWVDSYTTNSQTYEHFSANYMGNVKYIAVKYTSADSYYIIVDDFTIEEAPSCLEPTNVLASDETTTSATISWTAGGSETEWDIYFTTNSSDVPTASTTPTFSGLTTNSFNTVTNNYTLTPATTYYVYVRAVCSGTETSGWSNPGIFNTECYEMNLPFSYGFEDGGLSVCWTAINESPVYMSVSVASDNAYEGTYHLFLDRRTTQSSNQIVVLPEVSSNYALKNCEVSFYAMLSAGSSYSAYGRTLTVGVMTDPDDVSTFVAVGSAVEPTSSYAKYTFDLSSYTGDGQYIAIKHDATSNGYTYIDNLEVKALRYVKHITGYGTGTGNWYLIASPIGNVAPTEVTNMLSNNYDLFYFDQAKENEWVNYKPNESGTSTNPHFGLEKGKGYLYANSNDVDLVFTGQAHNTEDMEIELNLTETASGYTIDLPGWNLVGNPYAELAYIDIVSEERPFYTMNGGGTAFEAVTGGSIEPMEGIFVVAEEDGETMTFTTTEPTSKGKGLALNLSDSHNRIDRAIVRFNKGRTLPKLMLFENSSKIYIPVDGKDYAVVRSEEVGEMPVNFKAENNGSYTLSLSVDNVEFGYLHLIDNKTGMDIDLLQTPSYTFEAKTTDYESRFKLVFATGDNSKDDNFAYFSNGSFVINNDGKATLQVIDIMGRILKSENINGCANLNVNAAPGVYMLRLVNGDNVKVQKVVVK